MKVRSFICLLLSLSLTACSYFSKPSFIKSQDKQYLSARSIPPLKIPPGISGNAFHNFYPVSNMPTMEETKEVSLIPPGLN